MIETNRPMSKGRSPTQVGIVSIITDGYYGPYTNMEVSYPSYPIDCKGYIADGYGVDLSSSTGIPGSGYVLVTPNGYNERIESGDYYYRVYRTPKFQVAASEGDVINKPWRGVVIGLEAQQITKTFTWNTPGPWVPDSETSTPQTFFYTFGPSDDPNTSSPDFSPPGGTIKEVLGNEYLYYAESFSDSSHTTGTMTVTEPDLLIWRYTITTPP